MDPLGILAAVVALAVYPGGLFLAGILWFGGGLPWRSTSAWRPSLRDLAALAAIDLAVAGAPLPASPAASLPPAAGAAPDIVVVALLVAASVVLVAPGRWHVRRLLCAAGVATTASLSVIAAASLAKQCRSFLARRGRRVLWTGERRARYLGCAAGLRRRPPHLHLHL